MGNSALSGLQGPQGPAGAAGATGPAGSSPTADLLANRPAASGSGALFYATDQVALYLSVSSAWVRLGAQPGDIIWTAETSARTGYVLAQGQNISRTGINADLFAKWGTLFGAGDGSTTFGVFDGQGRTLVSMSGVGGHADVTTLGTTEGATLANRRPKHQHTIYDPGHTHSETKAHSNGVNQAPTTAGWFPYSADTGSTTGSSATGMKVNPEGASTSTSPLDTPAHIVLNAQIKL